MIVDEYLRAQDLIGVVKGRGWAAGSGRYVPGGNRSGREMGPRQERLVTSDASDDDFDVDLDSFNGYRQVLRRPGWLGLFTPRRGRGSRTSFRRSKPRIFVEEGSCRSLECFETAARFAWVGQSSQNQDGCVALSFDDAELLQQITLHTHSSHPHTSSGWSTAIGFPSTTR